MDVKKILIGAGLVVVGYQAWKMFSKPKGEPKSNASGGTGGKPIPLKYNRADGKVYKSHGTGFDARWVMLADKDQPKTMDWYRLNDKWIWSKWNGKLDTAQIPQAYILR